MARIVHEMLFYIVILIGARSLMYYCTNEQFVSVREAAPFPKTLNEKVLSQLGVEYSIQPESIF